MECNCKCSWHWLETITCIVIAVVLFIAVMAGMGETAAQCRREAIREGVARWTSDESGYPKFEWIKP